MENSDSENESFESAEESLHEEESLEEESKVSKKNKRSCESEGKVDEPVVSQKHTLHSSLVPKGEVVSNNSVKYRKRPERIKKTSSKSPTTEKKITRKSPTIDSIFKSDRIAPDVLFQDITSNLSKNINKSLNTLQQTSSNVRGLINKCLPNSPQKEGFSYDDNTNRSVSPVPTSGRENLCVKGTDIVSNHPEALSKTDEKLSKDNTKQGIASEQIIATGKKKVNLVEKKNNDGNKNKNVGNHENKKPQIPEINVKKIEIKSKELNKSKNAKPPKTKVASSEVNCEMSPDIVDKNIESLNDVINKSEPNPAPKNKGLGDSTILEKRNFQNSPTNENLETESLGFVEPQISVTNKNESDLNSLSLDMNKSKKNLTNVKHQSTAELSDTNTDRYKNSFQPTLNNLSDGQISSTYCSLKSESDVSLLKEDLVDLNVTEEAATNNYEWNLEKLKTVLEEMVPAEKNPIKETEKIEMELESNTLEVNETENEGWEDFDISDNEIDVPAGEIEVQKDESKDHESRLEDGCKKSNVNRDKLDAMEQNKSKIKSASNEKVSSDNEEKLIERLDGKNLIISGQNFVKKLEKEKDVAEKEEDEEEINVYEIKPASDDNWDWDSWDEVSQEKVERVENLSEFKNSEKEEANESNFCDESGWSGWDKFGQKEEEKQGNWNIGSWGVNLLINKATAVTQGISNVLEAGLNAPDPVTLARMDKLEREAIHQEIRNDPKGEPTVDALKKNSLTDVNLFPGFGITNLVAGVTSKIVEHSKIQEIGSKVITGGLDTLETFGKKTMEVLQDGDPGLRNKRALLLGTNEPILSQVLKEAREKAERESKMLKEKEMSRKIHFETLFDDFQGMVHLEALEMLSTQCELKLEQIRNSMSAEEQEDLDNILDEVQQLCSLDDYSITLSTTLDFKNLLPMAVESLKDEISIHQIIQIHEDAEKWLQDPSSISTSTNLIHQKIVSIVAELTAATVHQFHKAGELLSVKECRKTVEEVEALSRLTSTLCLEINKLCERFIALSFDKSNPCFNSEDAKSLKQKVNVVMKNSISYIKQAFNLLIPVVQIGAAV